MSDGGVGEARSSLDRKGKVVCGGIGMTGCLVCAGDGSSRR